MKLAGIFAVGLVAALTPDAHADCGYQGWVGTPTGASIPSSGALYVFDGSLADELKAPSGPIVKRTQVGPNVVRLDYVTKADELEISHAYEPTILQVNPAWKAPAAAPRVIQYWHHKSEWTCSHSDSLMLQIDQPTAAFRVYWQSGDRPVRQMVVPAKTSDNNISVLELGKLDCVAGSSIDPDELAAGGKLVLMAIRYDGSEVAVTGLPQTISTAKMVTSEDGLGRAIGFPAGTEPTASVPPVDHDFPFHMFLLLLIPAAALVYVAARDRSVKAVV